MFKKLALTYITLFLLSFTVLAMDDEENLYAKYLQLSPIKSIHQGGRQNQSDIAICEDDSQWVILHDKGKSRFLGFLYLEEAIKNSGFSTMKAADNRVMMHDGEVIYLSRYMGEERVTDEEFAEEKNYLEHIIKFTDIMKNANLRVFDSTLYVFDTFLDSFDFLIWGDILSNIPVRDEVLSLLQNKAVELQ